MGRVSHILENGVGVERRVDRAGELGDHLSLPTAGFRLVGHRTKLRFTRAERVFGHPAPRGGHAEGAAHLIDFDHRRVRDTGRLTTPKRLGGGGQRDEWPRDPAPHEHGCHGSREGDEEARSRHAPERPAQGTIDDRDRHGERDRPPRQRRSGIREVAAVAVDDDPFDPPDPGGDLGRWRQRARRLSHELLRGACARNNGAFSVDDRADPLGGQTLLLEELPDRRDGDQGRQHVLCRAVPHDGDADGEHQLAAERTPGNRADQVAARSGHQFDTRGIRKGVEGGAIRQERAEQVLSPLAGEGNGGPVGMRAEETERVVVEPAQVVAIELAREGEHIERGEGPGQLAVEGGDDDMRALDGGALEGLVLLPVQEHDDADGKEQNGHQRDQYQGHEV